MDIAGKGEGDKTTLAGDMMPNTIILTAGNSLLRCTCSLATALSSTSSPCVIPTVRRRFDERAEARASVEKVTEEVRAEKEGRVQSEKARAEAEAALRDEVC